MRPPPSLQSRLPPPSSLLLSARLKGIDFIARVLEKYRLNAWPSPPLQETAMRCHRADHLGRRRPGCNPAMWRLSHQQTVSSTAWRFKSSHFTSPNFHNRMPFIHKQIIFLIDEAYVLNWRECVNEVSLSLRLSVKPIMNRSSKAIAERLERVGTKFIASFQTKVLR